MGGALIREMQRIARERGAYGAFVQAESGDEPAIALYTKYGKRLDAVHFDLDLERESLRLPDGEERH